MTFWRSSDRSAVNIASRKTNNNLKTHTVCTYTNGFDNTLYCSCQTVGGVINAILNWKVNYSNPIHELLRKYREYYVQNERRRIHLMCRLLNLSEPLPISNGFNAVHYVVEILANCKCIGRRNLSLVRLSFPINNISIRVLKDKSIVNLIIIK